MQRFSQTIVGLQSKDWYGMDWCALGGCLSGGAGDFSPGLRSICPCVAALLLDPGNDHFTKPLPFDASEVKTCQHCSKSRFLTCPPWSGKESSTAHHSTSKKSPAQHCTSCSTPTTHRQLKITATCFIFTVV